MTNRSLTEVEKKLADLQRLFKRSLPAKISEIKTMWQKCCQTGSNDSTLSELHRLAHSLAGSGGTYGAMTISTSAHALEQKFKLLLDQSENTTDTALHDSAAQDNIVLLISVLELSIKDWQPKYLPRVQPNIYKGKKIEKLIYLVDDDELVGQNLAATLEYDDFKVIYFTNVKDFETAFDENIPDAVIMDMVFSDSDIAGANIITKIKRKTEYFPPVIFISVRNDIEVRLAAARAGASRFFCKPVDMIKLSKTLEGLTARIQTKPYRVLLVDDDEVLLEYFSIILMDAQMEVKALSNPLECLDVIADFKPDIIVLDVYMSECSGLDLAQVIRQDDVWAQTPIMFLSTENGLDKQLAEMNLGGDDFLVKPIEPAHLVSAVTARAKRARWISRLNVDFLFTLRESEYKTITMDEHDIVSSADVRGIITSVNNKFCDISGYTRGELIGKNHRVLKSNYHSDLFYQEMWETISSGQVWHGKICNYKKNGDEYWVDSTIVPFMDEKGKPYKYVSARTDVTEVLKNEVRLEQSQEFGNIGSWDMNIETGDVIWSRRMWQLLGYDHEKITATYENFMAVIYSDDRQRVADAVLNCVENGADYDIEHRVLWPDGSLHWLHESGNVIYNHSNKIVRMLGVAQDITERKNAEQELIDKSEEAENANRAKSEFLSSMSHELRTPMNAIMGFSQLLMMDDETTLSESQQENVNEISKAGSHLLELINQVLDLAKIEAGYIDLYLETVGLGDVIFESLQLIDPLIKKHGIEVTIFYNNADISLEQLTQENSAIRADRTRLRQVLLNLLSNAVKYNSENGKINIKIENIDVDLIKISVSDTGKGIAADKIDQLFKAFNRLGAESTEIEGTGIGLVITKNIVERMGGSIGVESEVDKGSTFWFKLPSDKLLPGQAFKADSNNIHAVASLIREKKEHERTVLYIEDNPANLRLVSQLLGRMDNLHMWSAHEPVLGLELAAEHKPDLILLDINLPGMDGFEVLKRLRQLDATRNTPIIAISANAMPKDIEKGMKAGFDDYITKPINVKNLLQAVDKAIEKSRQ